MNKDRLKYLLQQHFDNTINSSDFLELRDYLNNIDPEEVLSIIDERSLLLDEGAEFDQLQSQTILNRIKSDPRFDSAAQPVKLTTHIIKLNRNWLKVAAIITVFGAIGFYLTYRNAPAADQKKTVVTKSKILPGRNRAILTQANGNVILLDSVANGVLVKSGKCQVNKVKNGKLVYNAQSGDSHVKLQNALVYNTLTTPRGGEYQVVLPDGTNVWLNSSSSLSYPIEFVGNERRVKLTGEAYFEVAKNKEKPFYINVNNVQVRVLGTHFNIAAYSNDQDLTTTLLEGAVQVNRGNQPVFIKARSASCCK